MKTLAALRQLSAISALVLLFSAAARADTLTVPAVTSLPVGAAASPFFSDVRVFNTSYTSSVGVTAVYRCFLGPCPAAPPQITFTLGPRESRPFDDMIQQATVIAVFAYDAAMRDEKIPRKALPAAQRGRGTEPQ